MLGLGRESADGGGKGAGGDSGRHCCGCDMGKCLLVGERVVGRSGGLKSVSISVVIVVVVRSELKQLRVDVWYDSGWSSKNDEVAADWPVLRWDC